MNEFKSKVNKLKYELIENAYNQLTEEHKGKFNKKNIK